jgi:hypothetical protein
MLRVPAIIAASIIAFVLGAGAALMTVTIINPDWRTSKPAGTEHSGTSGPEASPGGSNMGPMGGAPGGGRAGGGGRGGGGPSSKAQLAALVTKLDQLTGKPLSVSLNEEQQAKLREELKGLDEKDDLSDDEAKKHLDSILEIVKGDKDTLEAAGYRWPGQRDGGGSRAPAEVPNPFKEEDAGKHLKALREQLKAKSE